MKWKALGLVAALSFSASLVACGGSSETAPTDAATPDAMSTEMMGTPDAMGTGAATPDAMGTGAATPDAMSTDAATPDAMSTDAATPEATPTP